MLRADRTTTPPPAATAVITVDPIGDEHRTLFSILPADAAYVVAVRRNNRLVDVSAVFAPDASALPLLRERARAAAAQLGGTYWEPCGWCGTNCTPQDRVAHDRLSRGSETAWRAAA